MKKTLALASVVLMAGALTACGGDDSSSSGGYCDQLQDLKNDAEGLDFTKLSDAQFSSLQNSLNDIEASAPSDVKDDWATFNDTLDQIKQILDETGLSFDDIQAIQENPNDLPDGVDLAKLQELAQKMQEVSTQSGFQDASDAIQQNVKDECDINLDDTSTTGS
jgi:hypothetical protein